MTNIPTSLKSTIHTTKPLALLYSTSKTISSDFKSYSILQVFNLNSNTVLSEIKLPVVFVDCVFYSSSKDDTIEYIIGFGADRLLALKYDSNLINENVAEKKSLADSFSQLNFNLTDLQNGVKSASEICPLEILSSKEFEGECIFDLNIAMSAIAVVNNCNSKLGVVSIDFPKNRDVEKEEKNIFSDILPANPKITNKVYSIAWNPIASHIIAIGYKNHVSVVDLRELNELTKINFITNQNENQTNNESSSELTSQSPLDFNDKIKRINWFGENKTTLLVMTKTSLFEYSLLKDGIKKISKGGKALIIGDGKIYSIFKDGIEILSFYEASKEELNIKSEKGIEIKEKVKSVSIKDNLIILTGESCTKIKTLDSLIFTPPSSLINLTDCILISNGDELLKKSFSADLINEELHSFVLRKVKGIVESESLKLFNKDILEIFFIKEPSKSINNKQVTVPLQFLIGLINKEFSNKESILNECRDFHTLLLLSEYFWDFDVLFERAKEESTALFYFIYMQYIKYNENEELLSLLRRLYENKLLNKKMERYYCLVVGDFSRFLELSKDSISLSEYAELVNCRGIDIPELVGVRGLLTSDSSTESTVCINTQGSSSMSRVNTQSTSPPPMSKSGIQSVSAAPISKPGVQPISRQGTEANKTQFMNKQPPSPLLRHNTNPMNRTTPINKPSPINRPMSPSVDKPSASVAINKLPKSPKTTPTNPINKPNPLKPTYIPPMDKPKPSMRTNYQINENDETLIKEGIEALMKIIEYIKQKGSLIIRTKAVKCEKKLDNYESSLKSEKVVSDLKELFRVADLTTVLKKIENKPYREDLKDSLSVIKGMADEISGKYVDSGVDIWVSSVYELLQCVCSLK